MLLHWLVLFGIITSVLTEIEDGVSYVVGPGKRDCFYRILKIGDRMDFDLQVYGFTTYCTCVPCNTLI